MSSGRVYDFKSAGAKRSDPQFNRDVELPPVGIATPLSLDSRIVGPFKMHYTLEEQIHDNLKNLILTNHGDRLGNFSIGANLNELCLEFTAKDDFDSEAMLRIRAAVKKSMPFVELRTFQTNFLNRSDKYVKPESMALLSIKLQYDIPRLRVIDKGLEVLLYIAG